MGKDRLARDIISRLKKEYPHPATALNYSTPFELLVATMLSAQTTDARVNLVTEKLFRKYRTVKSYAETPPEEMEKDIRSVNFYRTKARNIVSTAITIMKQFNSVVPRRLEDLTGLPGVARKTANIVLWEAFGINEGIAVDTHVRRLAQRLGLSEHDDPVKIERDLMSLIPRKEWGTLSHLLILHGRAVCQARNPGHLRCVLFDLCPSNSL